MDLLDKVLLEWSARTEKGYPDLNNEQDLVIFESMFGFNLDEKSNGPTTVLQEQSTSYDDLILKRFIEVGIIQEGSPMPRSSRRYKFPGENGNSYFENVYKEDLEAWDALWNLAPPAAKTGTASKGVGAGEVALYWLYNYSESGVKVTEGREGSGPDLFFDGVGVEVKAEGSHTAKIGLGRFSEFKEEVRLLTILFGLSTLTKVLQPKELEGKVINPTNFRGIELIPVFESFNKFANLDNLSQLASQYGIFKSIYDNIELVKTEIGNTSDPTAAAGKMVNRLLKKKLAVKPKFGGFLVNLKKNGSMKFFGINEEKLEDYGTVLNTFVVQQSKIGLNYSKVFG